MSQAKSDDGGGEGRVVQAGPETRSLVQALTARWPAKPSTRPGQHGNAVTSERLGGPLRHQGDPPDPQ